MLGTIGIMIIIIVGLFLLLYLYLLKKLDKKRQDRIIQLWLNYVDSCKEIAREPSFKDFVEAVGVKEFL